MTDMTTIARRALGLMDLTTLNDDDTDEKIIALCRQANSAAGQTAAICIYPRFVPQSSLADHLEVYLGEYVPLKSKDVQLEHFDV